MRYEEDSGPQVTHFSDPLDLLTAKDLEGILKIDVKTIYSYVQRGLIPYVRIQSNVRFLKSQIAMWIESQHHAPLRRHSRPGKPEKKPAGQH